MGGGPDSAGMLRLALATVLLAASAAQAAPAVSLGLPTQPVPPGHPTPFATTVTLDCSYVLTHQDPAAGGATVTVAFSPGNGVVVTGPSTFLFPAADCAEGQSAVTKAASHDLFIPLSAPGLVPLPGTVKVAFAGVSDSAEQTVPFTVTADYYAVSQAKLARKLGACDACALPFQVTVTNLGNARTHYVAQVVNQPAGWTIDLPDSIVLAPGASADLAFVVHMHGTAGEGAYTVVLHPSSADDPAKAGEPLAIQFLARNTSILAKAAPAPAAPGLAVLLLAAAVACARRRA